MNGYIVIGREQLFDVPLGLFETHAKAHEIAEDVESWEIVVAIRRVLGIPEEEASDKLLSPTAVGIVEFFDGEPRRFELVKEFETAE